MAVKISTSSPVSRWQVALCPHRAEDLQGAVIRSKAFNREFRVVDGSLEEINQALAEIPRFRTQFGVSLYFATLTVPFFLGAPEGVFKVATTAIIGVCSPLLIYSAAKLYKLTCKIPSIYPRVRPELLVRKIL